LGGREHNWKKIELEVRKIVVRFGEFSVQKGGGGGGGGGCERGGARAWKALILFGRTKGLRRVLLAKCEGKNSGCSGGRRSLSMEGGCWVSARRYSTEGGKKGYCGGEEVLYGLREKKNKKKVKPASAL